MTVYVTLNREGAVIADSSADAVRACDGGEIYPFPDMDALRVAVPELNPPYRGFVESALAEHDRHEAGKERMNDEKGKPPYKAIGPEVFASGGWLYAHAAGKDEATRAARAKAIANALNESYDHAADE